MNQRTATESDKVNQESVVATLPNLLIVWDSVPHRGAGADLLMRRIFLDYPADKLAALTTASAVRSFASRGGVVSAERLFTAPDFQIHRRIMWYFSRVISWLALPLIVWRGVRIVRRLEIQALFTVPWNQFFAAAYLVHRLTGRPLYVYVMDDHEGKHGRRLFQPPLYALFMPRVIRAARRVWCVSEGMRDSIAKRFRTPSRLLLPTADIAEFRLDLNPTPQISRSPVQIIYTGAIYGMQLDALQRLVRIVAAGLDPEWPSLQFALTLYTSAAGDYLRKIGLTLGPNTRLDKVQHQDMPLTLAMADILFLPMSFEPGMKHVVSTSIPSKIAEYVASGVPILVHGPAYCSAVRYCREFDCGLVVDQPDDTALRDAMIRLATDASLRKRISANALEAAQKNHDAPRVVANFQEELRESLK